MDLHAKADEICKAMLVCGELESFLTESVPRAARRCCSGSIRTFKSYAVKVNAPRSSAQRGQTKKPKKPKSKMVFIQSRNAFAARSRIVRCRPQPKHSEMELCPAWELKPGSRTSFARGRAGLCPQPRARQHNASCSRLRCNFVWPVHRAQ